MSEIINISAREVLDSRANPTIEAEVRLASGAVGRAMVPSGASVGRYEAVELRDAFAERYNKKGVLTAVKNVNTVISDALCGVDSSDIRRADSIMITLDGMYNKSNLGANAILSVSLAIARAAASELSIPLYRYLGGAILNCMPIPMMNILNGGVHSGNNVDIQEFMIVPTGASSFSEGVRMCAEVYHKLRNILLASAMSADVGDEGGFAPMLMSDSEALDLLLHAISESGYKAGKDFFLAIDAAASEWRVDGGYVMPKRKSRYTSDELVEYFSELVQKYPIISIEDPLGEDDIYGWKRISEIFFTKNIMLVGDDLFVTDSNRIKQGIKENYANTVLIKPNQIGTLSEAADAVFTAKHGGYKTILSHRSGETEDTFIADLSVALGCDFIKMGAPARAERTAKYNRLMKIESEMFAADYGNI